MRWPYLVVLAGIPAAAEPAVDTAKQAEQLAAAGDFAGAAAKYRAAYAQDPRPEFLCNVGVAFQRAKVLPKAQFYLGECLQRGSKFDAKFVAQVRTALTAIEDKLRAGEFAPVDIVIEPAGASASFEADDPFVGARVVWLAYGHHTLTVTAEGYVTKTEPLDIADRSPRELRVVLARAAATRILPPPPVTHDPVVTRGSRVPAITATGATGALALAAAAFYIAARGNMSDAASTTIDRADYDHLVGRAHGEQHASWVFAGLAAAGAGVSTYLWVHSKRVEVRPAGVAVRF